MGGLGVALGLAVGLEVGEGLPEIGLGLVLEVGLPLTGLGLAVGLAGLGLRLGLWLGEADGVPLWLAVTDVDGVVLPLGLGVGLWDSLLLLGV